MIGPAQQPPEPETARLAPPDRRLLGFLIDAVILVVVSLPFVAWILGGDLLVDTAVPPELSFTLEVVGGIYYVVFTAMRGQTPGKMLVRTKVVDLDRRELPSWTQSFVRWAIPAAAGAVPVFGLLLLPLVYAWLLWDPRRQGLHDKAARTLVLDLRPTV